MLIFPDLASTVNMLLTTGIVIVDDLVNTKTFPDPELLIPLN